LQNLLSRNVQTVVIKKKTVVFGYYVKDAKRYGFALVDMNGNVMNIEDTPNQPKITYAVFGCISILTL